jgi:hypothetical protein
MWELGALTPAERRKSPYFKSLSPLLSARLPLFSTLPERRVCGMFAKAEK